VTSYDPFGANKEEHSAAAVNTTDGNPGTYWSTERYDTAPSLGKPGVGVVLDAGALVDLAQLVVVTDTPGFTAQIEATNTEGATPEKISDSKVVGRSTTFDLSSSGPKQYYVIWITKLPPDLQIAHVNEVRAYKP
jgi:putative peptidoglycan lipid II flippase